MAPLAIAGAIIALASPHLCGLAVLGCYSIPSHMFISPFPHEPVLLYYAKFFSIAGGYPLWKYEVALLVGRAPRFYTLAVLGYVLQPPTWLLIVLALGAVIAPLVKKLFDRLRAKLIIARERSKPKAEVAPLASSPRRVPSQLESSAARGC